MNIRLFTLAILVSALPALSSASQPISLRKEDFLAAKKTTRNGETLISVKLSKSGKAKFKKLNKEAVDEEIHAEIGGIFSSFRLREPIRNEGLEMGPYSAQDAETVVSAINRN